MNPDPLDEAYQRLRATGPEFDGWLTNHGPMAAEALSRHDHADAVPGWVTAYSARLEPAPRPARTITDWREALGDPRRLGDWAAYFDEQLREDSWTGVLATWWPRLLPGIAAGATHGVIRVGHAVRSLREDGKTPARVAELAQGLGYWAARWQQVPGSRPPGGSLGPEEALAMVPPVPRQDGGIVSRLEQLGAVDSWPSAQHRLARTEDAQDLLRGVVAAAVRRYATHAHGSPVMLVHAATAPNAVLRTLPSLPRSLWADSAAAGWSASAAVYAAYGPTHAEPAPAAPRSEDDAFDRAAQHGDEHVIKLADTAIDVYRATGDTVALAAVANAVARIDPL